VTKASSETGAAAQQVLGAAETMTTQSATLREVVEKFLHDVKAA